MMSIESSKPKRRKISAADKVRILAEYDAAQSPVDRASIMRREGVYSSLISNWRKQIGKSSSHPERGRPRDQQGGEIARLQRENERLRARAEKAEDLVETLGKVHALLQNAVSKSATETQQSRKP